MVSPIRGYAGFVASAPKMRFMAVAPFGEGGPVLEPDIMRAEDGYKRVPQLTRATYECKSRRLQPGPSASPGATHGWPKWRTPSLGLMARAG
jgi:hypothetical protein